MLTQRAALDLLGITLQAEPLLAQQVRHRSRRNQVAAPGQLLGKDAGGLDRPAQRRARIAALVALDQSQQRGHKPRVAGRERFASRTRLAHPLQRFTTGLELRSTLGHRDRADPAALATTLIPPWPSTRVQMSRPRCSAGVWSTALPA